MRNIVCFGPCATIYKGGIAQFFSALVRELKSEHKVRFITWSRMYPGFLIKRNFKDSQSETKLKLPTGEPLVNFYNPFSLFALAFTVRKEAPALAILNWAHPVHAVHYLLIMALIKILAPKTTLALICHNVLPHESFPGARSLTRAVFSLSDRVIVHSRMEHRRISRFVNNPAKALQLFMPVFDFFEYGNTNNFLPDETKQFRLLFFGAIRPYKGVDVLLRGFAIALKDLPNMKLIIAGEYFYQDHTDSIMDLAAHLNITHAVTFINEYIANEHISELIHKADALVFPFRSITQSASLTLAIANGKPSIVSKLQAFKEIIKEGETGCLFKTGSPEDLASAIVRFYNLPPMRGNVESLKAKLSWHRYTSDLMDALFR